MNNLEIANNNGSSMPTEVVAVESKPVIANSANAVKLYTVPITADIQAYFTGYVQVYASSSDEAASKVQAQIDDKTVDDEIEMHDFDSAFSLSYKELTDYFGSIPEISENDIEVEEDEEVDPADVLKAEVTQLQASINWDFDKNAKLKAFLETLNEPHVAAA